MRTNTTSVAAKISMVKGILYIRVNKEKHGKNTQVKNCSFVDSFAKGDCLEYGQRQYLNSKILHGGTLLQP